MATDEQDMKYNGKELNEILPENWDGKSREMLVWWDGSPAPSQLTVIGYDPVKNGWIDSEALTHWTHCAEIPKEESNQVQLTDEMIEVHKMIAVMKAYTEGKHIEYRGTKYDPWREAIPRWDWNNCEYRVKPESTYRPYKNLAEFKKDIVRKYGGSTFENILETRHIWLKSKCKECIGHIDKLTTDNIFVDGSDKSWKMVFNYYSYLDGSPFGIKE